MTAEQAAHVLIVDDEADMRELLSDLIESAGLGAPPPSRTGRQCAPNSNPAVIRC